MASANSIFFNPPRSSTSPASEPIPSLESKVKTVALVALGTIALGSTSFLITLSLPITLGTGVFTLLLFCAWTYFLHLPPALDIAHPKSSCIADTSNTPLHIACARRDLDAMRHLIQDNSDRLAPNNNGQAPISLIYLSYEEACDFVRNASGEEVLLSKEEFNEKEQEAHAILYPKAPQ